MSGSSDFRCAASYDAVGVAAYCLVATILFDLRRSSARSWAEAVCTLAASQLERTGDEIGRTAARAIERLRETPLSSPEAGSEIAARTAVASPGVAAIGALQLVTQLIVRMVETGLISPETAAEAVSLAADGCRSAGARAGIEAAELLRSLAELPAFAGEGPASRSGARH